MDTTSYQISLDSIRSRFLNRLFQRLEALEQARDSVDPYANEALETLLFEAHKASGAAATLGFMDLGELCQTVERAIHDYRMGGKTAPSFQHVLDAVDDMLGEMALIVMENVSA